MSRLLAACDGGVPRSIHLVIDLQSKVDVLILSAISDGNYQEGGRWMDCVTRLADGLSGDLQEPL